MCSHKMNVNMVFLGFKTSIWIALDDDTLMELNHSISMKCLFLFIRWMMTLWISLFTIMMISRSVNFKWLSKILSSITPNYYCPLFPNATWMSEFVSLFSYHSSLGMWHVASLNVILHASWMSCFLEGPTHFSFSLWPGLHNFGIWLLLGWSFLPLLDNRYLRMGRKDRTESIGVSG